MIKWRDSKNIPIVDGELSEIQRLQTIRNTFIHQQPDLYVFTFEELYELIVLAVKLSRFLISESDRMALGVNVNKAVLENQLELMTVLSISSLYLLLMATAGCHLWCGM